MGPWELTVSTVHGVNPSITVVSRATRCLTAQSWEGSQDHDEPSTAASGSSPPSLSICLVCFLSSGYLLNTVTGFYVHHFLSSSPQRHRSPAVSFTDG